MKIAYVRSSEGEGNEATKLKELKRLDYDTLHIERDSGKGLPLAEMDRIVDSVQPGDIVCVTALSQIGRSLDEIVLYTRLLTEKGAAIFSIADNIDEAASKGDLNLRLLSSLAERDRRNLVSRFKAGRKAAKEKGVQFGRKKGLSERYQQIAGEVYKMHKNPDFTTEQVREHFKIGSQQTLYKILSHHQSLLDGEEKQQMRQSRTERSPALKLFYFDFETTGPRPAEGFVHRLAFVMEVNGEIKLRDSLPVQPPEADRLPDDYLTPFTQISRERLREFDPPAAAVGKLCGLLSQYVDPTDPSDKFFLVGYDTQKTKIPLLRGLFDQAGSQSFDDYFYDHSFDLAVFALYYLWERRGKMEDFGLDSIYREIGGNLDARKLLAGKIPRDARVDVEMCRQIFNHITTDRFL